jgi:hypothetical protein
MSKSALTLEHLGELLAHEKAAANVSEQTLTWYTGTLRRYSEWLASRNLAPMLANFTAKLGSATSWICSSSRRGSITPTCSRRTSCSPTIQ